MHREGDAAAAAQTAGPAAPGGVLRHSQRRNIGRRTVVIMMMIGGTHSELAYPSNISHTAEEQQVWATPAPLLWKPQ